MLDKPKRTYYQSRDCRCRPHTLDTPLVKRPSSAQLRKACTSNRLVQLACLLHFQLHKQHKYPRCRRCQVSIHMLRQSKETNRLDMMRYRSSNLPLRKYLRYKTYKLMLTS